MSNKTNELFWGDSKKASLQESKGIEEVANRIYFYSKIDEQAALTINRILSEMSINHLQDQKTRQLEYPDPIFLHICTPGGLLYESLSIVEAIRRVQKEGILVHTIIDGYVASGGTLMSVIGDKRQIGKYSYMLIHQLSAAQIGKYDEVKDSMKNLDKMMENVIGLYKEHSKFPEKKLEELLKHDLILDAETCLKYGLVDEIA